MTPCKPSQCSFAHPLLLAPVLPRPRVLLLLLLLAAGLPLLARLPRCLTLPPLLVVAVLLEAALPKLCCLGGAVVHEVEGILLLCVCVCVHVTWVLCEEASRQASRRSVSLQPWIMLGSVTHAMIWTVGSAAL